MPPTTHGGRRSTHRAAAATAVLLLAGGAALTLGLRAQPGPPQPDSGGMPVAAAQAAAPSPAATATPAAAATPAATATSDPTATAPDPSSSATPPPSPPATDTVVFLPASRPTGIVIPSIGVRSTTVVDLGVAADGTITVPGSADEVGFYTGGPTPGQLGPAVLAAHVDSRTGPGVFYRLGAIKPGDTVAVSRADGTTATFRVDKVATYPKDRFPTEEVYRGGFRRPEIRLVTCGGPFDPVRHYLDNVVVFGHLESVA